MNFKSMPIGTDKTWESEGLEISMVEPMKKWTITYDWPMMKRDTGEKHNVVIKVNPYYIHIFL